MASTILPTRSVGVFACATTKGNRKPEVSNRKGSSSSSANWFAPIFGWSTEPDYIETGDLNVKTGPGSDLKLTLKNSTGPGGFTEDKARQLRKMMTETTAFHDAMYHSSIAAKLASDFSNSSSGHYIK